MVLENLLVIPPLPNLSDSRCRAFCNSLKGNVTSLAASSRFHISAHSVNFVNLAANLSEWPVLGNQMVRNAQGSMSHKPPGFPQTHPWVWLFQCGWAQWMGHCHCLSQLCPCSPGGWVALGRWRDPSLLLSSGRTGRIWLLYGLFVCLGSWQEIAQKSSPARFAPTDGGAGQEHSRVNTIKNCQELDTVHGFSIKK